MSTVIEHWECTRRDGVVTITFDAEDGFRPSGNLSSAAVDPKTDILDLTWASGHVARLPDAGPKIAWMIAKAPSVSVRWTTADDFLLAAELVA
jgi:hypothetical protein